LVRVEYGLAEAQASSELNRELAAYAGLIQAQELVDVVGAGGVACVGLPGQIRSIAPPNLSKWGAKMYADRSIFRKAS